MSTTHRRKNTSVIEELKIFSHSFSFTQAVCLLERANVFDITKDKLVANKPIAGSMQPSLEFVRFASNQSFSFASSEIATVTIKTNEMYSNAIDQWHMTTNFIGLTGTAGVLPYHYTETALQRLKQKDKTMIEFFNLFNHRTTSLFFQAACKYNFSIEYQRKRLPNNKTKGLDNHTQALLSLVGLGTENLSNRMSISDESLLFYSGLLTSKVKTTSGLKQMLENHFEIPVEIKEFVGQWQELISDVRTKLPSSSAQGQNNKLGHSVMLGKKGWFAQGKINIILGPLNKKQLSLLSPDSTFLKSINELVRFYLGYEQEYSFIMRVRKQDVPKKVSLSSKVPTLLGWTSWLPSNSSTRISDNELVDIPISTRRFNI